MLCHTPLLFACTHTWCYARHVFCTLAHILNATLGRSSVRLHTYFMLPYTFSARLHTYLMLCHTPPLFACTHTPCDARQVFCTLAHILDATLHLFCMLAHILDATLDTSFERFTSCKARQWRFGHGNQIVAQVTAKTLTKMRNETGNAALLAE